MKVRFRQSRISLLGCLTLCLLAGLLIPAVSLQQSSTTRYVNKIDLTCQGHSLCYASIQTAVDATLSGDTVRIQSGAYDEVILIKGKNNTPGADEADRIIIEADPAAPLGSVVLGSASQKCGKDNVIQIESSRFLTVRGLTITDAGGQAIVLAGGNKKKNTGIHLERNRLFGNGPGKCLGGILIGAGNADTVLVNNLIYGSGQQGLVFEAGEGGPHSVVNNTIHGNGRNGVSIGEKQEVLLVNNILTGNGTDPKGAAGDGFGVKRPVPAKKGKPEQAQLLRNLICGNSAGELSGPILDGTDVGNLTPTGTEGPGVSASAGCQVTGTVYANVKGLDGTLNSADDDFSLAAGSPAIDRGIDPRTPLPDPDLSSLFTADFTRDAARPRDGDSSGTAAFDLGAIEKAGECEPGATATCYTGPAGTEGVGVCTAGISTCGPDGTFGACIGQVLPGVEVPNNGIDENCDGSDAACSPGATESCYTGPTGTQGVGICRAGTKTCGTGGTFGACTGEVLPGTEIPDNGIDEDCNGADATSGGGTLPPDPSTVAPPVEQGVVTSLGAATAFLYTGNNPIQTGVDPVTIDARRVAVLRGKVLDKSNAPLSGVTITILNHPEFGQTLTRTDGMFDFAVNGGGMVTVNYARAGYLAAQRQVQTPWRDYAWLPDVVMIPYDRNSTLIDLTATTFQVAQGSTTTDTRGTRQATLLFPPGTQATMHLPDGSTQPLTVMHVRATEQSVGENGPESVTAEEPPTTAYTYGVDFSADEAVAAKALSVEFNQPVILYVQNFIGFPVGGGVPVGGYDNSRGLWVPHPNGRVVKVLSITNGQPTLDVKGTGQAASAAELAELEITAPELQEVGRLYTPGQTLWRAPIPHFTYWDT